MPLYNAYTNSPQRYWKDIKNCLNGETIVAKASNLSDIEDVIDSSPYMSCDISSSPFHALANFAQSVKGYSVTTSRSSSYQKKVYYIDENDEVQSYIQREASYSYQYNVTLVNTGLLGRFAFFEDVPSGQQLSFPPSPIQVDGWNRLYDLKYKIAITASDDVGTWNYTSRNTDGDEVTESGEIRPLNRPALSFSEVISLNNSPDTLYFKLASSMDGVRLVLYKDGNQDSPPDCRFWFAATTNPFVTRNHLGAYDVTNNPNTNLSSSPIVSPVSGMNMEGLAIEGPARLEDDEDPSDPQGGEIVRTYTYNDSHSLTWLYY